MVEAVVAETEETKMRWVEFRGKRWLLVGNLNHGGAITTPLRYNQGEVSYAHLFTEGPDAGKIMRFKVCIGLDSDVTDLGPAEDISGTSDTIIGTLTKPWTKETDAHLDTGDSCIP